MAYSGYCGCILFKHGWFSFHASWFYFIFLLSILSLFITTIFGYHHLFMIVLCGHFRINSTGLELKLFYASTWVILFWPWIQVVSIFLRAVSIFNCFNIYAPSFLIRLWTTVCHQKMIKCLGFQEVCESGVSIHKRQSII